MTESLESAFTDVYTKFKLQFYQRIFQRLATREATLTTTEAYCVEIISALGRPTVSEFAKFVNISVANATYKVQNLIKKGYVRKERSKEDRRESYLHVTEHFYEYQQLNTAYVSTVIERIRQHCSADEVSVFERVLVTMSKELMPEVELGS
ncbi:MAG: MarR family transcriptional regulator [Coriobacteriia bacterium]|jgi:DNA-binding MarR family transcriptional regulator|nr:MarR family transcriptional regulator [Coriobacteriia bacterium]MDR2715006.1 MarR family transcriptional regulator [Coriobacteriales bacterium]